MLRSHNAYHLSDITADASRRRHFPTNTIGSDVLESGQQASERVAGRWCDRG